MEAGKEPKFSIEYVNTASNFLIGLIVLLYIPLLVSPFIIIPFNLLTAIMIAALLLALAFGIYVFRGNPSRKKGVLAIAPGDARIERENSSSLNVGSRDLALVDEHTISYRPAVLFETRIRFQNQEECFSAWDLLKQL